MTTTSNCNFSDGSLVLNAVMAVAASRGGDRQWLPPDGRRHDHGGEISAGARAGRRLLHAEHADGRALRGTIARVDSHPRGLEPAQGRTARGAVAPDQLSSWASPTGLRACLWFAGGAHILEMNGDSYRLNQSKRRSRHASSDTPADNPNPSLMSQEKAPVRGPFLPASLMYFCC